MCTVIYKTHLFSFIYPSSGVPRFKSVEIEFIRYSNNIFNSFLIIDLSCKFRFIECEVIEPPWYLLLFTLCNPPSHAQCSIGPHSYVPCK